MDRLKYDVRKFGSLSEMSDNAAEYIVSAVESVNMTGGICAIALPGGDSPKCLFQKLGSGSFSERIQWSSLMIFWSDERYIGPDSEESNFRTAYVNMLCNVPVPDGNIFRVPVGEPTPGKSALLYERIMREQFLKMGGKHKRGKFPAFDIMILGVGEDGHTASLFPGSSALEERARWAVHVRGGPELKVRDRITLTLPVINASVKVVFVVSGRRKGRAVSKILSLKRPGISLPASRVQGTGKTVWFIDESGG